MVVRDRDIGGALCGPAEDNAPMVVDPDRVPAGCPALEWFKSVSWWNGKVLHLFSRIRRDQLTQGASGNLGKAAVGLLPEEFLCVAAHLRNVIRWRKTKLASEENLATDRRS